MPSHSVEAGERQLTHDVTRNHELDNNDNFSPDDRFLVFDTRTVEGGIAASKMVGKVEIATGKVTSLYEPQFANAYGSGAGAASFSHTRDEVIFIHGPFHPSGPENQYEQFRRVGVIAAGDGSGEHHLADARCIAEPSVIGALRGGTHRHEFSGDGNWVGFTYNDAVMINYGQQTNQDFNLRTIGVTQLGKPVNVSKSEQFPNSADGFSALVVVVVPNPKPGSDEISRAAGDSWVGRKGYLRPDGKRQMARAFIGTARDNDGNEIEDLYIVDIPDNITAPGSLGPLQGTATTFPMPPAGTKQRRLVNSSNRKYPGCMGIVRASHDGSKIAFLMKDDNEAWQVFLTTPQGEAPVQATFIEGGVDAGVRWHPNGKVIVNISGTKIVATTVESGPNFGKSRILSDRAPEPFALVWSHDGKTIAYNRIVRTAEGEATQIFVTNYQDQ